MQLLPFALLVSSIAVSLNSLNVTCSLRVPTFNDSVTIKPRMTETAELSNITLVAPSLFTVKESSTGLGAFARGNIPAGTVVLDSNGPDILVLNEAKVDRICAWCLKYNAYEPWTLSINECPDLNFCRETCKIRWYGEYGSDGLEAYTAVKKFLQKRRNEHAVVEETELKPGDIKKVGTPRLRFMFDTKSRYPKTWQEVEEQVMRILAYRKGLSPHSDVRKKAKNQLVIDPECMMLILDGLLCRSTSKWLKIDTLKANEPWRDAYTLAGATRAYLHLNCVLPLELLEKGHLTRRLVERILAVDAANSFGVNQPSADKIIARGIWADASFFNHSCSPNLSRCRYGRRRVFKAKRDISEGEELCIAYLKALDPRSSDVSKRRMTLLGTLGFVCQCTSCKEEAETSQAEERAL